jgi:1,4-alpha-glucan branching enzyme
MSEVKGRFTLVLHSHLPYVLSHGRWPHGADWLNEAAAECYIPLLRVFNRLLDEGIVPKISIGLTPVLCEQLASPSFEEEFSGYLAARIEAAAVDEEAFAKQGETELASLATMWKEYYSAVRDDYTGRFGKDLLAAFKKLQDQGAIEIITCAATHGYLPLLGSDRSVAAQVKTGVETYKKHFDRQPAGIWLPECAYRPSYRWSYPVENVGEPYERLGVEEVLFDNGLAYFIVDHHLLEGGKAVGVYADRFDALKKLWGAFADQYTQIDREPKNPGKAYFVASRPDQEKTTAVLVRDPKTGAQVWSGESGYPGDGAYLEFHKKHFPGGNRYWRVTSSKADLGDKKVYDPAAVENRIKENAGHFKDVVKSILLDHHKELGEPGLLCAPFDAELFGHWWFEGPEFLYWTLKWIHEDPEIEAATGEEQLQIQPPREVITLPEGSWGEGGYHFIWLNEWTEWSWKHIYKAENRFEERLGSVDWKSDEGAKRILTQMARELLLLQGSDWQFLISTWSARDYAENRLSFHSDAFTGLDELLGRTLDSGALNEKDRAYLEGLEERDSPFADLDLAWWGK